MEAFSVQYLRLDAGPTAGERLIAHVHTESPEHSAPFDWSRSPGTSRDTGRSDREGVAQRPGETTRLAPAFNVSFFGRARGLALV